jgi:hypothetical protein
MGTVRDAVERYFVRMRVSRERMWVSMVASRAGFSRPEYWDVRFVIRAVKSNKNRGEGTYTGSELLAALVVQGVVGLAKDHVALVFEAGGLVEPGGALVIGLGVDAGPDFGVGRDEEVGANARDGAVLVDGIFIPSRRLRLDESSAVRELREAGSKRSFEMAQPAISRNLLGHVYDQQDGQDRPSLGVNSLEDRHLGNSLGGDERKLTEERAGGVSLKNESPECQAGRRVGL